MKVEPKLDLNDSSRNDDSIKQEHVTINASNGATINSNSGNGQRGEITRMFAMITTILFSIICYAFFYSAMLPLTDALVVQSAKESGVRFSMIRLCGTLSYAAIVFPVGFRLVEEYRYYLSIGGNYDVEDRFESFRTKVMGTREIAMK